MRQRLGLAAALLRTPRLLLLDEPTTSLDPAGTRQVRTLLERLVREGASVVLSSHDMNEVEAICDAVTILHVGKVVFSGTVDELRGQAPASIHALRTSNDAGALLLASRQDDVQVAPSVEGEGLDVSAEASALDAYVIALGHAGIAIRRLEQRASSLESLFLQLTTDGGSAQGQAEDGPAAVRSRELL
jgi:ABC-2 type transport system ATP-binding protein